MDSYIHYIKVQNTFYSEGLCSSEYCDQLVCVCMYVNPWRFFLVASLGIFGRFAAILGSKLTPKLTFYKIVRRFVLVWTKHGLRLKMGLLGDF